MRPGHFTVLDWLVLLAYFVATVGIGLFLSRRGRSTEGFTAANRTLPSWACGLSIFATFLSSISFLPFPVTSFPAHWNPFVFLFWLPLDTWVVVR